jgi:hypothetical protein
MLQRIGLTFCLLLVCLSSGQTGLADLITASKSKNCLQCHASKRDGFDRGHAFVADDCVVCHAGDETSATEDGAHADLISFPGTLDTAARACGSCHPAKVASVTNSLMHTGRGIVDVTRRLIDEDQGPDETVNFQSLGHSAADSMLRKLCASCHLGQAKTEHRLDVMRDRGGGCLACHINDYPENTHPTLTTKVSDGRCFGCHSRSGRISLSFAGLAEVDRVIDSGELDGLRLSDGRRVERKAADVHYLAGMSCIDCHTGVGLMGGVVGARHQRQAVDISCTDCHDVNRNQEGGGNMLTTAKNHTPLSHIEVRKDGAWLHTKITGRVLRIPSLDTVNHADDRDHQRLECATCHSQWAPQCFGCHMEYDADGTQWDHVERRETSGRWSEKRSLVQNELATLGVNENDRIELFVPGMIMTVAHPDWHKEKLIRVFAALSPHTTGQSRTCASCHRSSEALGLGQGELVEQTGETLFRPTHEALQDGLPGDAWTNLDNSLGGRTPAPGQRPLNHIEMEAILDAPVP